MIKIVLICLSVTLLSSCISVYDNSLRDSNRCVISAVDPKTGTLKQAIEANEENYKVNIPDCNRIFNNLDL